MIRDNENSEILEGFKMTELNPLPEGWEVVRLGEVVRKAKGKKPKLLMEKWKENSIPYLTAVSITCFILLFLLCLG